jgi:uncharacterized membrane protein SpoIIM required for sporulation
MEKTITELKAEEEKIKKQKAKRNLKIVGILILLFLLYLFPINTISIIIGFFIVYKILGWLLILLPENDDHTIGRTG